MTNDAIVAYLQARSLMTGTTGLVALTLPMWAPLLIIGIRRRVAAMTYLCMPLHVLAIFLISLALQYLLTWLLAPTLGIALTEKSFNDRGWWLFFIGPLVATVWAYFRYGRRAGGAGDTHKRGALVLDGVQAAKETRSLKGRTNKEGHQVLTLAGVWIAPEDETKHFKLIGTTGAGKSTAIRELLHQVLERGDRAVIADPDGGYLSRFYDPARGDVILNPFDARSHKWNAFLDITGVQDADLLARSMVPGDGEWNAYARTFVAAVLRQCKGRGTNDASEIWRLIATAPSDELRPLLQHTAAQPFLEIDNARMFGSIRAVAGNAIAALEYIDAQRGTEFSVREWVRSGKGVLFMPYQAEQIAALRSLIATWLRLAIFQTMSLGEKDNRLWFVVDELDALGHIDGLKDALARLRKFGGRCVLGFQSIAQVSTTYGDGPARTIVENCSNSLILRCSASEGGGTARFASGLIGEREIIRQTVTQSTSSEGRLFHREVERGFSYGEEHRIEDAVLASEIEALPDRTGFVKFASRPEWSVVEFDYFDVDKRAEPFEEVSFGARGAGGGGGGSGGHDDRPWPAAPTPAAQGFAGRAQLGQVSDGAVGFSSRSAADSAAASIEVMRGFHAYIEAMRNGDEPVPQDIAEQLRLEGATMEEFFQQCQNAAERVAGTSASTLAAATRDAKDGHGTTDYVEIIKRMAAQGREPPGVGRG